MAQWLRHPTVETLVFTGSSPALAKNYFLQKKIQIRTQCIANFSSPNNLRNSHSYNLEVRQEVQGHISASLQTYLARLQTSLVYCIPVQSTVNIYIFVLCVYIVT